MLLTHTHTHTHTHSHKQFVDSLSHCRHQIEERQAEITRLTEYTDSALMERSDSNKQFEQLRADIAQQTAHFTTTQVTSVFRVSL